MSEEKSNEDQVSEEETSTPEYSPTPTAADAAEAPNGTSEPNGEKISAYKKRMQELGREGIGAEIPVELADMMRAAAKKDGDIALTAWIRLAWADAVNASGLTKEDGSSWTFDKASLEATQARTSTRGMTDEQKKAKKEEKAAEEKDQKALVKRLLEEHRAKLKASAG